MTKETFVPQLDLRELSRDSDTCLTQVFLHPDWDRQNDFVWIQTGQTSLRKRRESESEPSYDLTCYVKEGATDFEHDSAYLFVLPLIGLTFASMRYQQAEFIAYVDPNLDPEDFKLPSGDYNPFKHQEASKCPSCKGKDKHMLVPYLPPSNIELYHKVKGKKVSIVVGPVLKEDP